MLPPGTPLRVGLLEEAEVGIQPIGRLAVAQQRAQLEWTPEAIAAGRPVDPLLYPLEPGLLAARSSAFEGLHGFLADSLPEGWGALLMRRRLAKLGVRFETLTIVDRLALVGSSGRGALVFEPDTTPPKDEGTLDLDALAREARAILAGDEAELADMLATLGGASGGARPKVHVALAETGSALVDTDDPPGGHEAYIVKFRAISDPIDNGPIEAAYARMAELAGIDMPPTRLLVEKDGPGHFATRRFDRPAPGRRAHVVSLAGALEAPSNLPSLDYDGFLRATAAITRHADDVAQAFRRMIFNILACNRDDHSRQHSFVMDERGNWRLSPAYDLTFSIGPGGEHYLSVEGEGRMPSRSHVATLGKRHGIPDAHLAAIIDAVRAALSEWPALAATFGVTASRSDIATRLDAIDKAFTS